MEEELKELSKQINSMGKQFMWSLLINSLPF